MGGTRGRDRARGRGGRGPARVRPRGLRPRGRRAPLPAFRAPAGRPAAHAAQARGAARRRGGVRAGRAGRPGDREFLELEASGWKGDAGTAVAASATHAEFFTELCRRFAGLGRLELTAMRCAGQTLAMATMLTARDCRYAFKLAFDEEFRKQAPGAQLIVEVAENPPNAERAPSSTPAPTRQRDAQPPLARPAPARVGGPGAPGRARRRDQAGPAGGRRGARRRRRLTRRPALLREARRSDLDRRGHLRAARRAVGLAGVLEVERARGEQALEAGGARIGVRDGLRDPRPAVAERRRVARCTESRRRCPACCRRSSRSCSRSPAMSVWVVWTIESPPWPPSTLSQASAPGVTVSGDAVDRHAAGVRVVPVRHAARRRARSRSSP